ncbi:MAG: hypothetical protein GY830_08165 [Bacteroidetes bacterium]|nr:hypothetical protein [Bacteroidota bacterium]
MKFKYLIYKDRIIILSKIIFLILLQLIFQIPDFYILNFCFIYLYIFFFITINNDKILLQLLLTFILGICLDIVSNTNGIYAFSLILFVYSRYNIANLLLPKINFKKGLRISISRIGIFNFLIILICPIFLHNFAFYFLENIPIEAKYTFKIFYKIILSTIITSFSNILLYILSKA